MRDGQCCDRSTFLKHVCQQSAVLDETREGQVWIGADLQRREKKLSVSFELYNSPRLLYVARETRLSLSGDGVTPVDIFAVDCIALNY